LLPIACWRGKNTSDIIFRTSRFRNFSEHSRK
jgi:hypothetical protein